MKYSFILCIPLIPVLAIKSAGSHKSTDQNLLYSNYTFTKKAADSVRYATLYIYREWEKGTSGKDYDIHVADSTVCRVTNDSKCIVKLYREGTTEIWAKTETKSAVSLNVEFGKDYYLKCELRRGALVIRPAIRIISEERGKREFNNVEKLNN